MVEILPAFKNKPSLRDPEPQAFGFLTNSRAVFHSGIELCVPDCTSNYQYVPAYWWIVIEENANTLALLTSISSWAHQPLKRLFGWWLLQPSSLHLDHTFSSPGQGCTPRQTGFGSELWILKLDDSREILHMIILKEGGWLYLHQGLSRLCQVCYWLALGCRCPVAETCKDGASEGESSNVQLSGIFAW